MSRPIVILDQLLTVLTKHSTIILTLSAWFTALTLLITLVLGA